MPAKRHTATQASRLAAVKRPKRGAGSKKAGEDEFFLHSDEEDGQQERREPSAQGTSIRDQQEEEEARETAEEKRLRLAKAYLSQLRTHAEDDLDERRGVTGGSSDDGGSDEEEGAPATTGRARLTKLLQLDAAQAAGRVQRNLAASLSIPTYEDAKAAGTARRGHRQSPTALALSLDDQAAWTVAKDGGICKWDIETGKKTQLGRPGVVAPSGQKDEPTGPEWVKKAARSTSRNALNAVAVSSDGTLLAVGGGDRKIHLYDARTGGFVQSFPGHRDAVTALAFREGTHTLFSGSLDRTVKLWSMDDRAYMDTLFGHQAEVLGLDVLRADRAVSAGADRACRIWKIPEESQLIFKYSPPGGAQTIECCRYVTGTDWVTGTSDGCLQLWTQTKRKPVAMVRNAHGPAVIAEGSAASAGATNCSSALAVSGQPPDVTGWVQSVAAAPGSDLVASGAGDGAIRLWQLSSGKAGGLSGLKPLGSLPARGWVNGLAISRTGRFVVAAVGQEPRLGRWARDGAARNGLLLHRLSHGDS